MLRVQPFGIRQYVGAVLEEELGDSQRPVLAGEVEGDMVGVGYRVEAGGPFEQPAYALEIPVDDTVDQWRVVVVVDEINRLGCDCIRVSTVSNRRTAVSMPVSSVSIMSSRPCMLA
jgi:hypothetical protein